jgi:carbohydrate-selective porin OprB
MKSTTYIFATVLAAAVTLNLSGRLLDADESDLRFVPTTRPGIPEAQNPPAPTPENTDTGKPVWQWQRLTDDWRGYRPQLEQRGLTFQGSVAIYVGKTLTGGVDTKRTGFGELINVNLTLDTQRLCGVSGGTFFVNFQQEHGLHRSLDGSFNTTSHLYMPERKQVSEAWYQQDFCDDKLKVKLGKIDVNTDFDVVDYSGEFLDANMTSSPTILFFPTDPDLTFGADVFIYPTEYFYAGFSVFDGSLQSGSMTGAIGPANGFRSVFVIAEVGATWSLTEGLEGRAGLGVWHHTGTFEANNGAKQDGATGPYFTFDQMVWRKNPHDKDDARGIAMFGLGGYTDPAISQAEYQLGGGAKWTGAFSGRDEDVFGVGINYLRLNKTFLQPNEWTTEAFYKIRINKWLSVEPDIQYISSHDALVATVQLLVDF